MLCTKPPPKRVSTSKSDCSMRITVWSSRNLRSLRRADLLVAEVARDDHARARALLLLARAETAADREHDEQSARQAE